MKKLLQSTLVRVVCQVLAFAMLATLIPNGLTTKAYAQSGSALGSEPAKKVGVVDFINDSNRFGQIISKNATSAFIMEANKDGHKFVVEASNEDVKAKMDELGIRSPASTMDCINIAYELGLDGMIQGFIKSINIKGTGANKVATATVAIQYVDVVCGDIIMGASAKGESSARIGFTADEDTLAIEAVEKAISNCLAILLNYNVPKATVHANEGETGVILNAGVRNNLYPGLRMVVLRGAYPEHDENLEDNTKVTAMRIVGWIEVTHVNSLDATAKIIKQNVGIKPEDICLGLYNDVYVSKYSTVEESINNINSRTSQQNAKRQNSATNIGYILLGAAALVGLVCLFSGGGNDESGPSIDASAEPGYIKINANKNNYIDGDIVGLNLICSSKNGTKLYETEFMNDPDDRTVTTGKYDGKDDLYFNVFNVFDSISTNEQYQYSAEWIYLEQLDPEKEEDPVERKTAASGSATWTKLDAPTNLEPSSTINANEFEEGTAFIWTSTAYSRSGVNIRYVVNVWDASNENNKVTFNTTDTKLSSAQLAELWEYFNKGYAKKTFVWSVGVQNTLDSNPKAYNYSQEVKFTVDSLPPAPPSKGKRR